MPKITGVYDGLTVRMMARAFADVCRSLPGQVSAYERELIAKRILGTAALGERDPAIMRSDAITYLGA